MNASYAFRSHLMQQFVAQARTQSRPPLALLGIATDDSNVLPEVETPLARNQDETPLRYRHLSSVEESSSRNNSVNIRRRHTDSDVFEASGGQRSFAPIHSKQFSASAAYQGWVAGNESDESSYLEGSLNLPIAFQTLLQTRRSTSKFAPLTAPAPIYEEKNYWEDALERAVLCGKQAPNHKRTEPFTFKRMIAPSERTERLCEIAYRVSLRQTAKDESFTKTQVMEKNQAAQRKREKWSRIPAFLVATVEEEQALFENDLEPLNQYDQLPFCPPKTERALEDYASACAAVQNVLLSLHSEKIATKWVTGPVIRTPAFRELVQANDHDRIVALIMVGQSNSTHSAHARRYRRPLKSGSPDDVLVDL